MAQAIDDMTSARAPVLRTAAARLSAQAGARRVLGAGVAAGAALGAIAVRDPRDGGYPLCPLYWLTGTYCPGCGTLRGLNRLLHLDLAGAIGYNALMVASIPIVLIGVWFWARKQLGRELDRSWPRWGAWTCALVVLVFGVTRNLPWAPFTALAP